MAQDAKAEAKKDEAAEPAKPSKKKLIIIIAAVLVLAIGGGAGWYFTQAKHPAKKEEKHEEVHAPVFVPLETFTVNLQPDPDEKFLQLDVTMEVSKPEIAEKMKTVMPAIRNRMLMLLTSKKASDISTTEGKAQLSQEILAELKKPYAKGEKPAEVNSILFTSFVVQ